MASRMDRYYQNSTNKVDRSTKNKELYKKVYNGYTNKVDSISSIKNSNEIDISKIKDIVNNRESYKKEKELRKTMEDSSLKIEMPTDKMNDQPVYDVLDINPEIFSEKEQKVKKNYDLSDVLTKAKDDYKENDSKNRNLKNLEYSQLNSLNLHNKEYKNSEAELKDLINTIHSSSKLNKLSDDVGLLDELKSDTSIGDVASIKKVLEEKEEKKDDTKELDKSFFTSAYDFNAEDFDEGLAKKHKKRKQIILMLIICLIVSIIISTLYFLGMFNFKAN